MDALIVVLEKRLVKDNFWEEFIGFADPDDEPVG
jgi:hypothetical protein